MAMFPMTLGDLKPNHPNFCIFVAFHIFVVSKHRDFILVYRSIVASFSRRPINVPERGVVTSRDTF